MKKILFGVSDTKECRKAINCLVKLFGGISEFQITLLHVISEVMGYAESRIYDYNALSATQEVECDSLLKEFEAEFLKHSIQVDKLIAKGTMADVLLEVASDYDLLVIGESESSLLHRIFNSHQDVFINSSPIPVLVAK